MWTQKDHIKTLHTGMAQTVRTHENLSYYRFYVPSHTWFLEVSISNCHNLEQIIDGTTGEHLFRWCIKSLSIQARSLPSYSPEKGVVNITQGGNFIFTEFRPFSDGYYYILIDTEGETSIDIAIRTRECDTFTNPLPHLREARSEFAELSSKQELKFVGTVPPVNITVSMAASDVWSSSTSVSPPISQENSESDNKAGFKCYPILPLARIRHATDFMDTFLIQGPEWYSTWLSVRGEMPLFTHLTLLPFTDIGGTLNVNIHMDELLMNATSQLITILGCMRKGRPPEVKDEEILCEDQSLLLNITSFSSKTVEDFILIPFPEPDIWYLALQTICFYRGVKAPCIIDQAMVSVDIRTQPCVYAGEQPCGEHGLCQETHRGMFFFTSCVCKAGWEGWGCENGGDAKGWTMVLTGLCLLTVSNIFFLPPAIIALRRRLFSQALLFIATMIASVFYHTCDNEVVSFCAMKYEVLQFTDFFFSLLCFWVTVVGLGGIDQAFCPLLHTLGVVIIAPAVQYSRTGLASFIVPMAVAVAIPACHIVYCRWRKGTWPSISRKQLLHRSTGIMLALSGLIMFALVQTKDNYKYVHSAWHVAIALSLVFLLPSGDPRLVGNSNLCSTVQPQSPINNSDAELIDIGLNTVDYTAHSPVFNVTSDVAFLLDTEDEAS
ncbi:transmembrane protein 8B-like isoform X2 [Palaemon carinicauda]